MEVKTTPGVTLHQINMRISSNTKGSYFVSVMDSMPLKASFTTTSNFVTKSKLALLLVPQANKSERSKVWRPGVAGRNTTLFGKPADQEDSRLMSQNNHLLLLHIFKINFIGV